MRVLFLTNSDIAYPLANWLEKKAGETLIRYSNKLSLFFLNSCKPDILISYNYRYIIKNNILSLLKRKAVNLHISLLPWNRGADPNLWSFLEETPKGVTIHFIDEGIDTGDILLQKEIRIDETKETLKSSYHILHEEIQRLFKKKWYKIKNFNIIPVPQKKGGSIHYKNDAEKIKQFLGKNIWNMPIEQLKKQIINKGKSIYASKK